MRLKSLLWAVLLALCLIPSAAQAETYSASRFYMDERGGRYWQVMADVRWPSYQQRIYTGGAATTSVYFDSLHQNRLNAATQAGLAQHDYYLLGSSWRFDVYRNANVTVGNMSRWYAQPFSPGASYSYFTWYSPLSSQHYQTIHFHSPSFWSEAKTLTHAEDLDMGSVILSVSDRNYFQVLQ